MCVRALQELDLRDGSVVSSLPLSCDGFCAYADVDGSGRLARAQVRVCARVCLCERGQESSRRFCVFVLCAMCVSVCVCVRHTDKLRQD